MIRKYFVILMCTLCLAFSAGVWAAEEPLAAKVNGVDITQEEVNKSLDTYLQQRNIDIQSLQSPEQYKEMQKQVLDGLIGQELLWQEAQKKKAIVSQKDVDQEINKARERMPSEEVFRERLKQAGLTEASYAESIKKRLSVGKLVQDEITKKISISDAQVHEFYAANPGKFTRPEEVHTRHILIKVESEADEDAKQAAKKKIDEILGEAKGGTDFAELAKKHSEGPTGPKGGDLGFTAKGQLVPAFEKAAFALKPGEISDVVQTQFGYHIIKLEERRGGEHVAENDIKEQIRTYLQSTKSREAVQEEMETLRKKGSVEILMP